MALTYTQARQQKDWLKGALKCEFANSTISVGLASGPHDFAIRIIGKVDVSTLVANKVREWLPQSNPDVRYVNYIKPA